MYAIEVNLVSIKTDNHNVRRLYGTSMVTIIKYLLTIHERKQEDNQNALLQKKLTKDKGGKQSWRKGGTKLIKYVEKTTTKNKVIKVNASPPVITSHPNR